MKTVSIDHLVYAIKKSGSIQSGNDTIQNSGAIFFLGAGMSKAGGIPLAGEIAGTIKNNFKDNPFITELGDSESDYSKLMNCLLPSERNELLKSYVDQAKVNSGYLYLANLVKHGYVDYVLTVNFDNLMQKASSLLHLYPATYDMAILKDLTTTNFHKQSIIHLHGHFQGPWLLNTQDEMEKVREVLPKIFDSIKHNRPWVFVGYSGNDPVFEHLRRIGRFDNGLYWVTHKNTPPSSKVNDFISNPHTNAFLIRGYDADSFMVNLNNKLLKKEPKIWEKPFNYLKETLALIKEPEDMFTSVSSDSSLSRVELAINIFGEDYNDITDFLKEESKIDEVSIKESLLESEVRKSYYIDSLDNEFVDKLIASSSKLNSEFANFYKSNLLSIYAYRRTNSIAEFEDEDFAEVKIKKSELLFDQASSFDKTVFYLLTRMSSSMSVAKYYLKSNNLKRAKHYIDKFESLMNELANLEQEEDEVEKRKNQLNETRCELIRLLILLYEADNMKITYIEKANSLLKKITDLNVNYKALEISLLIVKVYINRNKTDTKKFYKSRYIRTCKRLIELNPESANGYIALALFLVAMSNLEGFNWESNYRLHESFQYLKAAEELHCKNILIAEYYREIGMYKLSAQYLLNAETYDMLDLSTLDAKDWEDVLDFVEIE